MIDGSAKLTSEPDGPTKRNTRTGTRRARPAKKVMNPLAAAKAEQRSLKARVAQQGIKPDQISGSASDGPGGSEPPVTLGKARRKPRHWGLFVSLLVFVVLPLLASSYYLFVHARDQYASTTGFTIRQEETGSASEFVGGLTQLVGRTTAGNADLLFEFIQSQEIVERVRDEVDLIGHYSANWPNDPIYSIWPDATIEDLVMFWRRMVRITYEKAAGLITFEVRARDPETARQIGQVIVAQSERMINLLNETARKDSMTNAQADLDDALARLRSAREAIAQFRARTQILDPQADIQGRMGVLNNLQQQLAQALVDYDLLLQNTEDTDPRVRQVRRRIEVIEDRIVQERKNFAAGNVTVDQTDYPRLLAQYESLNVDREFAEETYRAALTALDAARSNAQRQQLYLATFVRPTLAERAEYPQRYLLVALTLMFALMFWAILSLIYYSLRDRG